MHRHFRDFGASDISELAKNRIRGESGAQEAAIKRCDSALIDRTSNLCKLAFDAPAKESRFVSLCEDGIESGLDVPIRDTAGTQFARDAETSLATRVGVLAGVFERVAGVIEIVLLAEARDDG